MWPTPDAYRVTLHESVGVLRYAEAPRKVILEADPGIVDFYRALIPKCHRTHRQMYRAHVSVVRNEAVVREARWRAFDGEAVPFRYENVVRTGEVYVWLNVYCVRLEEVRRDLGLEVSSPYTLPPSGFAKCFHMTLGNYKARS